METAVLALFKQENLQYIKWHLSENLLYISKFIEKLFLAEKFGNINLSAESFIKINLWL